MTHLDNGTLAFSEEVVQIFYRVPDLNRSKGIVHGRLHVIPSLTVFANAPGLSCGELCPMPYSINLNTVICSDRCLGRPQSVPSPSGRGLRGARKNGRKS